MADIKPAEVSAILKQQLSGFSTDAELEEVGSVLQVGDGIARIYGLNNVQSGELIEFANGLQGIVLNLEEDNVGAVLLGSRLSTMPCRPYLISKKTTLVLYCWARRTPLKRATLFVVPAVLPPSK